MGRAPRIILLVTLVLGLVMTGCTSAPIPTPEPVNREGLPVYQLKINLLGEKDEFLIDSQGALKSGVEISSADGRINLSADKDTTLLDRDGKPLDVINAVIDSKPPLPPEDAYIVGLVYSLEPQGATFDPWLLLALSYEPEELPEGVRGNDLYIAYHNGSNWSKLPYKRVDTNAHSVTTQIYHFTTFAILGPKKLAPSATSAPTQGTQVGNLAPDFQFNSLEGQAISLSDLRGKPVLINFWATRCPPCVSEMPYLQEIYNEWSETELMLLVINIGESASKVKEFLQGHNLSLPVLLDAQQLIANKYEIAAIPTTFFVDKDGIIQEKVIGAFPNKAEIEKRLSKIID
jgi:peroxiredoxin